MYILSSEHGSFVKPLSHVLQIGNLTALEKCIEKLNVLSY